MQRIVAAAAATKAAKSGMRETRGDFFTGLLRAAGPEWSRTPAANTLGRMLRTLTVAAIQTRAYDRGTLPKVWPQIAARIRSSASAGAQMVVLPEGTLPAYVLGYQAYDGAEIAAYVEESVALARELGIVLVLGAARRDGEQTYNSAIVIDAGAGVAGAADKHFLWHFDRQWFAPGERLRPIRTSAGNLGVLVCADGRIPLISKALVEQGAELLVMPTAWVTSGRDPSILENVQADLMARMRARENAVPFIAANKCGVELGCVAYCGKSQIIAADGSVLAIASQDGEDTLYAQIEIGNKAMPAKPAPIAMPAAANGRPRTPVRIAISAKDFQDERFMEERLRILEAELLVMPQSTYPASGTGAAPLLFVRDETIFDPSGLVEARLHGADLAVWPAQTDAQSQIAFARTRAVELRMYVIAIGADRAFAVDPDGAIVCGTFPGYDIAAFTYDPFKSEQTLVAPGTDVRAGLERARAHALS